MIKVATLSLLVNSVLCANVEFEGDTTSTIYPDAVTSADGFTLQIDHRVVGLGNICNDCDASVTLEVESYGTIDSTCYNNGRTAAPGQNPIAEGSGTQTGLIAGTNNGEFAFVVSSEKDCTCGKICTMNDPSYDAVDGVCKESLGRVRGVFVYSTCAVGAECCDAADPNDADDVDCPNGCDCRVQEGFEVCSNTKNWNQYADGVDYDMFTLDAVYDPEGDGVKEVQRLVCLLTNNGDGTYSTEAGACETCELCRETNNSGNFCDYEAIVSANPMPEGCGAE